MPRPFRPGLAAALLAYGGIACREAPPDTGTPPGVAVRGMAAQVAWVVMDGARVEETLGGGDTQALGVSDAWGGPTDAILPRIRAEILPEGALAVPVYVTLDTVTTPAHAALFTGRTQVFPPMASDDGVGLRFPDHPSLFELVRAAEGLGAHAVPAWADTPLLEDVVASHHPGFGIGAGAAYGVVADPDDPDRPADDDGLVVEAIRGALAGGARLAFGNLHQIDRTAHVHPERYAAEVARIDDPVADLWASIRGGDGTPLGDTLLVLLSDHGRHRFVSGDTPWAHHGCDCSGCREIPLLLAGPGVRRGVVGEGTWILQDVAYTVAWLMGTELPYATGLPLTDLLEGHPDVPVRRGEVAVQVSGGIRAWQAWTDDPAARSAVVVDGAVQASGMLHVEQPRIAASGDDLFACWRSLDLVAGARAWPWQATCAHRIAGGWHEIGLPVVRVTPDFAPDLRLDAEGRLWVALPDGTLDPERGGTTPSCTGYALARWSEGAGWEIQEALVGLDRYPTGASLRVDGDRAWVAFAASDDTHSMRYTRHVEVHAVSWAAGGQPAWTLDGRLDPGDAGAGHARLEHPALGLADGTVHVAAVAYRDDGTDLVEMDREAGGWSAPRTLDASGAVHAHVGPAWSDGGRLYWSRLGVASTVEICGWTPGGADPACQDTGAAWIDSLAPTDTGVAASVSDGDLLWRVIDLVFP